MDQLRTIRRGAIAALLATLLPGAPALAEDGGIAGLWAHDLDGGTCDRNAPTELVPIIIEPERVLFYESGCDILDATPVDVGNALRLRMSCSGEGDTWEAVALAVVDVIDDRLFLHWSDGGTFVGRRCP